MDLAIAVQANRSAVNEVSTAWYLKRALGPPWTTGRFANEMSQIGQLSHSLMPQRMTAS
ncbi:MAG: hypothetical protein ACU0A8_18160 [Limimaricola soesokkakensis]|uniref:hypothetical protein n=1 Tax=Limimaricola soesokkakensis TaxID=1343159 RepID=UPI0040598D0E